MSVYQDIINRKKKEWNCDSLMEGAKAARCSKIPFSSPLMNWFTYGGVPRNRISEFFGEPGAGKAQPLYSKILTPHGFTTMGDISIGDEVFDGDGNICHVTAVYPQGKRPIYEITTQGNNKIRVADNHLNSVWWYNETKHCREDFVWTTKELIKKFNQYGHWRRIRFDVPEVDWAHKDVPLDPYLLGALIGDGSLASGNFGFSNTEDDIISKVNGLLNEYDYELVQYTDSTCDWSMRVTKDKYIPGKKTYLRKCIEDLNLMCKSIEKHIPEIYLHNDYNTRLNVLQGLFDTDGCIVKGGEVEISTSSAQLSQDISFLVRSLGIRDTVSARPGRYSNDDGVHECNVSYQHLLKIPNGLPFFTSFKHSAKYRDRQHPPIRNIIKIDYIGLEECQCIMVDSPKHTYISDDFLPTHNTTTAVDVCKNAIDVFQNEYEERISELRNKLSGGSKAVKAELDDLLENGPRKVLYIDLEHSFDSAWAHTIGIDDSKIEIMQPPDVVAEDILQTIQELVESGEVGLIVLDSLPSLVPRAELEKKFGERTVASLAGLLTVFCRKIVPLLTRYQTSMIFINQTRENMDNPYVVKTPGGQAPKFYSSLRILFKIGTPVDFLGNELPQSTENPAGYIINAKIVKQKSAPNDRKNGSYYLMCQNGIRADMDYGQLAVKKYGIIRKAGAWFTLTDPSTGEILEDGNGNLVKVNGMAKVYEYLQNNSEYFDKLKKFILDDINGKSEESDVVEEDSYEE